MASTATVKLHRVFKAPPQKVYKAFINPEAMVKWFPPYGFTGKVHSLDARVGGACKMSFTNFGSGRSHSFTCTYKEMKPGELLRYIDRFDDPNLPGEMPTTVTFKAVLGGSATEVTITQENLPAVIPAEACYMGWQESLAQLAHVVEPEIPDEM